MTENDFHFVNFLILKNIKKFGHFWWLYPCTDSGETRGLFSQCVFLKTRVSNGTGQCNFSGQRHRNSFIIPGQRDNGTSSKFCRGMGQPVKTWDGTWDGTWFWYFATGWAGILTPCPVPSRKKPGQPRDKREKIERNNYLTTIIIRQR